MAYLISSVSIDILDLVFIGIVPAGTDLEGGRLTDNSKKIKIVENGPYLVSGNIPITEKTLKRGVNEYRFEESRALPQAETYALCRCGRSKNAPFCDGSHTGKPLHAAFNGAETASNAPYLDRAELLPGPQLDMLDDGRCAFLRFCHRKNGDAWTLVENSDNPENREEAIRAACECPSGRLTAVTKAGELLEPELEPGIEIIQDGEKLVSAGISVKGNIPIESSNGETYEVRNRVVLCRCGKSKNKPFCDASHTEFMFRDKY